MESVGDVMGWRGWNAGILLDEAGHGAGDGAVDAALVTLGGVAGCGEEDDGSLIGSGDGVTLGSLSWGTAGVMIRATGESVVEGKGVRGVAKRSVKIRCSCIRAERVCVFWGGRRGDLSACFQA